MKTSHNFANRRLPSSSCSCIYMSTPAVILEDALLDVAVLENALLEEVLLDDAVLEMALDVEVLDLVASLVRRASQLAQCFLITALNG